MFGDTIEICSSILVILSTAAISMLFVWLFCVLIRKCIEVLFSKK